MSALCAASVVVVFVGLALYLFQRGRVYRAVFLPAHVREFVGVVQRLREHAIGLGAQVPTDLRDKRVASTSAGLHVAYTAMPHAEGSETHVEHHVSVSLMGGYTAAAVGHTFVRVAMEALGFSEDQYVVGRSQRGIWHGAAKLDEASHALLAQREVAQLSEGAVQALFERAQTRASDPRSAQAITVR